MRCFVVLLCALVLASGKGIPSIKASSEVRVIGKELYSSINKKDTLKGWPSEEIKKLAGSDAWDGWRPSEGDIGKMAHIWAGMGMALVHIDNHYVVMGITSLEAGSFSTGAKLVGYWAELTDFGTTVLAEMAELWARDTFPIAGMEFKFTHVLGGYFVVLFAFLVITWHLTPAPTSSTANIPEIKKEMERIYKKHNPSKVEEIDSIVLKWKGREGMIIRALQKKYDSADGQSDAAETKESKD